MSFVFCKGVESTYSPVCRGIAVGAAVALLLLPLAASGAEPTYQDRLEEQAQIRQLASKVEAMGTLNGFADFMIPTAFIESRFNPEAGSSAKNNAARGWFGMRPVSAFNWRNDLEWLAGEHPNLLKDPKWAVATAADYAARLIKYNTDPGQRVYFRDLRRGWALPKRTRAGYRASGGANLRQFEEAIEKTGTPPIAGRRVFLGNYPGIRAILDQLGAKWP